MRRPEQLQFMAGQPTPYAQPPSPPNATAQPPPKRHRMIIVIVAVVVVAVAIVVMGLITNIPAAKPSPTVLDPAGTTWTLPASAFKGDEFTLNATATLSGSFVASSPVTLYVFNPQDYTNFTLSNGVANAYLWTSGTDVATASISSNFAAGSYYFAVVNHGAAPCTFTFSTAFEATAT